MTVTADIQARMRNRRLPEPAERRRLRIAAKLTLRDIAESVGASIPAVAHWEAGVRTPSGEFAYKYAEALDAIRNGLGEHA